MPVDQYASLDAFAGRLDDLAHAVAALRSSFELSDDGPPIRTMDLSANALASVGAMVGRLEDLRLDLARSVSAAAGAAAATATTLSFEAFLNYLKTQLF